MNDTLYKNYLKQFLTFERIQKIQTVLKQRTDFITICVEDIFQLHNTSAVMRSCEIFGIQNLHVITQKYGNNIDTEIAMGAQKWVDIHRYNQSADAIKTMKKNGYKIIATTPQKMQQRCIIFYVQKKLLFFSAPSETVFQKRF